MSWNNTRVEVCDEIVQRYLRGESCIVISKALGVAKPTVLRTLKRRGIAIRTPQQNRKGPKKPRVEKKELERLYVDEQTRTSVLATRYGVQRSTVRKWLRYYGIPVRSNGEELKLIPHYQHSCWKGGVTPLRTALWARLVDWKNTIRQRDGWTCSRCPERSNLEVHHVKPMRIIIAEFREAFPEIDLLKPEDLEFAIKTIVQTHTPEMGVCLCSKCHSEVDPYRRRAFD